MAWGKQAAGTIGSSTAQRYASSLKMLEPWLRGLYVDEIDKALVGEIVEGRRDKATVATIRRDLTALSSVLGYCEDRGWRDDNPALSRLRRIKERRDPIVLPDIADIDFVVGRCPGALARMVRFALAEGMRQNEIVTLERRQIDHARHQVTLYRTKGRRPRALQLSAEGFRIIAEMPLAMDTPRVFHHDGEPYRNLSSQFAAIVGRAQKGAQAEGRPFRPFRFHDLRHRYAVDRLKSGGNLYDLQQHLGHASVKTTELYLAYLTPDEVRSAKAGGTQRDSQVQRFEVA